MEGPEVGVYYRGRTTIENNSRIISLDDYVTEFAYDFTVSVTAIGKPRLCGCSEIESDGTFIIYGEPGVYHWVVYGKRGEVNTEPLKNSVEIKGTGPYKYI